MFNQIELDIRSWRGAYGCAGMSAYFSKSRLSWSRRIVGVSRYAPSGTKAQYGDSLQSVMIDVASTLNTLIHPFCSIFLLVNRYAEGLSATIILRLDQGNIESVWVHRQLVGARHACEFSPVIILIAFLSGLGYHLQHDRKLTSSTCSHD